MKKLLTTLTVCLLAAHAAVAQNTLAGNLTVQQTVKLTGTITPAAITSNVNDYAPTGFAQAYTLRLSADAARNITGLAGGATGRTILVTNVGDFPLTFINESATSTAANRFSLGLADYELVKGNTIGLWYDGTSSRWRPTNSLAVGGGGGTGTVTSVSVATANGVSGTVASPTTNPVITISLGAISPSSVAAAGTVSGSNLSGTNTGDQTDATLPFSDVTTNNVSTTKHGFAPKLPNDAAKYLDGTGTWSTPAGGGGGSGTVTSVSVVTANGVSGSVVNPSTTPAITLSLGAITPASIAASGAVTGSNLSGTNTGDQTSVTGNAGTATKLATARAINGVSFDGTSAITVPAAAGTLTGTTLASGVTSSSLTSAAGGTFGTAAFTAASAYDPAGAAAAITLSDLGGVPTSRTVNGHALTGNVSVTASDVGLGSVENTAISTWAGSSNLSTLGTITSGTWHGSALADTYIASAAAWNAKVSFPGFGTTGTTAAVGNDSRLSDARTPLAHNQAWSTITSTPTTLSGYGIADAQPLDSDLTSIAALSTTSYGRSLLTPADAAAARTLLGVSSGGVSSVAGRTGDVTLAQADISGLTTSSTPQFAKLGIGMAAPSDSIVSVQHSSSGAGGKSAVIVTGSLNAPASTDLHPDAYRDSTTYTSAVAADGYASYDSKPTITGSQAYNHIVGFQARPIYSGSSTLDLAANFSSQITHSGSGTITTAIGSYAQDPLGSGPITHNCGFYVGALTRGTNNWAFYNAGTAPSYFGGSGQFSRIGIGQAPDSFGTIMTSNDGGGNLVVVSSYSPTDSNSASSAIFRRARGTSSNPSPVLSGDRLGGFFAGGQYSSTQGQFVNTGAVAVYATENFSATSGGSRIVFETAANGTVSRVGRLEISGSGGIKFPLYGAGTLVTDASGNVTASSDGRLKNVSGAFTLGLSAIEQLQPKVFTWKPETGMDSSGVNVGFIAQDVQPAIPEAVGVAPDGMLTLSDRPIIAALVNAVKELKAENDELRKRLDKMETKK